MINVSLKQNFYDKYMPYLMALLLLISAGVLGWWGYHFYLNRIEQAAFKDLAENVEAYEKFAAMNADKQVASGGTDRLDDLTRAFDTGVTRHGSSKLLPFFYLYRANCLIEKNELDRDLNAILDALQSAINNVEKDNPFYYLLLTKKALVQSDNEKSKEQGLKELNELALDRNNPLAAMSGYYLGLHYYNLLGDDKDNKAKAKAIWQEALDRQGQLTSAKKCSWCELIHTKLNTIS